VIFRHIVSIWAFSLLSPTLSCGLESGYLTAHGQISFHVQNVKPDRVIFNTLINACGRAGAVERAFDVLSDMKAEATPVKPDHVTYGALIAACARGGQVRSLFIHKGAALQRVPRAQEVCPSVSSEWVGESDQYCQDK